LAGVIVDDMTTVDLDHLGDPDRRELAALLDRAGAAGDHPALPEPQLLAMQHPDTAPAGDRVVLARDGGELVGFALLSPAQDGSTVLHVVADPSVHADVSEEAVVSALIGRSAGAVARKRRQLGIRRGRATRPNTRSCRIR